MCIISGSSSFMILVKILALLHVNMLQAFCHTSCKQSLVSIQKSPCPSVSLTVCEVRSGPSYKGHQSVSQYVIRSCICVSATPLKPLYRISPNFVGKKTQNVDVHNNRKFQFHDFNENFGSFALKLLAFYYRYTSGKQKLGVYRNHLVRLSVHLSVPSCLVHIFLTEKHWTFLFHKKIAYDLRTCRDFNPRSFGQIQGYCYNVGKVKSMVRT